MIILLTSIESLKSGDLFRIINTENSNKFDSVMIFFSYSEKVDKLSIIQQTLMFSFILKAAVPL